MPGGGPSSEVFEGIWTTNAFLVIVCSALAGYNAIELLLLIFTTFNAYHGLYFWSLMIATWGIIPYCLGLSISYFGYTNRLVGYVFSNIGWTAMVTGQSVVLYSRLGVVLGHGYEKLLRFVKWMIIVNGVVLHSVTCVKAISVRSHYQPHLSTWIEAYHYIERIQMTIFCVQEFIISGIYMWKTVEIIRTGQRKHTHRIMAQLFIINLFIVIIDIGLLALEYRNLYIAEVSFKEVAYSVKLKLEFVILGKLVEFTGQRRFSNFFADATAYLDRTRTNQTFSTAEVGIFEKDSGGEGVQRAASMPSSATVKSDGRPMWIIDVERSPTCHNEDDDGVGKGGDQSISLSPEQNLADLDLERGHGKMRTVVQTNTEQDHNFDSESLRNHSTSRTRRTDSDLMYAEAMRMVSK